MNALTVIYAIARADFLERVRRYSYLITLLSAVCLGYAAGTGKISLRIGDNYRGLYTSAWIGAMVAVTATTFLSLAGFYIVKNAVGRDRRTGVGEILATTPLSRLTYLLGKFLSNFAVLASMVCVLALAAIAMLFLAAEDRSFHPWSLLSPFLLIALPAMAMTAALALGFETIGFLRRGFGNVLWFFVWCSGLALAAITELPWLDPSGLLLLHASMAPAARAGIPGYTDGFYLTISDQAVRVASGFHWNGVEWTAVAVLLRLAWLAGALGLVWCSSWFFDRFDPARARRHAGRMLASQAVAAQFERGASFAKGPAPSTLTSLTALAPDAPRWGIWRLVLAELRLAVKGYRWWWYAVAAGLLVAQLAAPLDESRGPLLAVSWLWPILVWSALGTREARFNTQQLLFSCPRTLSRQLPAAWLAGLFVAAFAGLGVAVRLALAREASGLFAWSSAAVFIPSLALALGVWAGTSKFFEGVYTVMWYVGPLQRMPGLDFTGSDNGPLAVHYALIYLAIALFLAAAAFLRRAHQLRGT